MATGSIRKITTKKGETRYQITVEGIRDPLTGKRNRIYKNVNCSLREAKTVMHEMITEMDKNKAVKNTNITFGEWIDEWLSLYLPNIEETTRVGYKTKIRCYIKPVIGDIRIKSLRAEHIQRLVNNMINEGLSPKSVRDTYNNINAAMKKAIVLRMAAYNPCEGVVLPKLKKYKAKVYDVDMIHTLLETAKDTDMYLPVLLCVSVGLRRGELIALRWDDIDFDKSMLSVRSNMVNGEKGYVIKSPKSEAGLRDIQIGGELVSELQRARLEYFKDKMALGGRFKDNNLVVRQKDGSPITPDAMTRKWRRFVQRYGLPDIRLHDLRHSNATALIQAGVNPRVVQQRLGHSDVNITLNTYTHVLPEMDMEAAKKLDDILLKKA